MALKLRSDSPHLISNKKEFNQAIKDYVLKDVQKGFTFDKDAAKFLRRTRMGGHLSTTLKKAGLENIGLQVVAP